MPAEVGFKHLPLLLRQTGPARLRGGGEPSPQTAANRADPAAHSQRLLNAAADVSRVWTERQEERARQHFPDISTGVPVLLQVDPGLEFEELRSKFAFEIVSEHEDGFVIVASADTDLTLLVEKINQFGRDVGYGSAVVAKIHRILARA